MVAVRVEVAAPLYAWAMERSGLDADDLTHKFPKLPMWESGEHSPTLKQLERFATATRTPVGYFFLAVPPDEAVPIPDLRTVGDRGVRRPSPDLLDTIYQCQQRQDWYRDYARSNGLDRVPHVGSLSTTAPVGEAASALTATIVDWFPSTTNTFCLAALHRQYIRKRGTFFVTGRTRWSAF
jgi:transcriptional regulator with XRE-family HTH domain